MVGVTCGEVLPLFSTERLQFFRSSLLTPPCCLYEHPPAVRVCEKANQELTLRAKLITHNSLSPTHPHHTVIVLMSHNISVINVIVMPGESPPHIWKIHTHTDRHGSTRCSYASTSNRTMYTLYAGRHEWYAVTPQIKYSRNDKYEYRYVQCTDPTNRR